MIQSLGQSSAWGECILNPKGPQPKLLSIEVVARLLELGANPHETWKGSTPWGRYLLRPTDAKALEQEKMPIHTAITELLSTVGIVNVFHLSGESSLSITSLRRLMQQAFPLDIATRLNDTLTKTLASMRKEKHKKKFRDLKRVISLDGP